MAIAIGDTIPAANLMVMGANGPEGVSTDDLFAGKKVLLFAVPGAFTPGCSMTHLPGYVANADKIKAAGIDSIVCLSVNDAFVGRLGRAERRGNYHARRWQRRTHRQTGIGAGRQRLRPGTRSQRYAMIVDDGSVTHLNVEEGPGVDVSSAETMMALL